MSQYSDPSSRPSVWNRTPGKLFPNPWRRPRSEGDPSGAGNLFWLSVLFLGAISLICISWGASSAVSVGTLEKSLRPAPIIPKVNNIDKAMPLRHVGPIEPREPPLPPPTGEIPPPPAMEGSMPRMVSVMPEYPDSLPRVVASTVEPPLITTEMGMVSLSRTEPIKAPVELLLPGVSLEPLIHASFYGLGRNGESPMVRYLRMMTFYPFMVAAFSGTPTYALAQGNPTRDAENQALLKKMSELMDKLSTRTEPSAVLTQNNSLLVEEIARVRKDLLKELNANTEQLSTLVEDSKKSKSRLAKIEADLTKYQDDFAKYQDDQIRENRKVRTKERLDELETTVASLEKALKDLRKQASNAEAPAVPTASLPLPLEKSVDKAAMEEFRQRLDAIAKTLARLETTAPSQARTSLAPPTNLNQARVMLVNLYHEDMLFVVNGKPYRVSPNANHSLDNMVPGAITYEVVSPTHGRRTNQTVTLNANETFTLTAR